LPEKTLKLGDRVRALSGKYNGVVGTIKAINRLEDDIIVGLGAPIGKVSFLGEGLVNFNRKLTRRIWRIFS